MSRSSKPHAIDKALMARDTVKLCINCIHCDNHPGPGRYFCGAARSLVTGKPVPTDCATSRLTTGQCGPNGKLFAPRAA